MSNSKAKTRKRLTAAVVIVSGLAAATGAIASTQPLSSENPFESDIPRIINGSSSGNGFVAGGPSLGDMYPSFPGVPNGGYSSIPGGSSSSGSLEGMITDGIGDLIGSDIPDYVPSIFKDIFSGNMGGILETIMGVLTNQNSIFDEISKVVLGDGWGSAGGNPGTPPDPYKIRLPQPEKAEKTGMLTRSPIVLRRDQANQYDQELGRAMAAPMLAEQGEEWLAAQITTSSDMMVAGLTSTQSSITKAGEATEATSTQEIVRRSAEMSGIAATMQMQEMQQNALLGESLWNMQRLESAQLQLAANASEAADEQNRRDRASRTASLANSATEGMIIPGLADLSTTTASTPTAPAAPSLFVTPSIATP